MPLSAYAGVYRDQLGLELKITVEGGALKLRYSGGEAAMLDPWHRDTFRTRWENRLHAEDRPDFLSFDVSERAAPTRLHLRTFGEDIDATRTGS